MEKYENTKIEYPTGLIEKDIELINLQCEYQRATSPEQILGFAKAYKKAKDLAQDIDRLKNLHHEDVLDLILDLAGLIEKQNIDGFRRMDVTIRGNKALSAELLPKAMENFAKKYAIFLENPPSGDDLENPMAPTPIKLYKEFEEIHPFSDGNGRVGDLLWKLATTREKGIWPEALPPNVFGE